MDLIVAAPGRAGGALALAAAAAGHRVVALVARSPVAPALGNAFPLLSYQDRLPPADLVCVAARDGAIGRVAALLATQIEHLGGGIHLSGYTPVSVLSPLAEAGLEVGSFHPLQTLPDPELGAAALAGSSVAITADGDLQARLHRLAGDLGMSPFDLADDNKPAYHAAASATSNFVVAALGLAEELFQVAGVPLVAARPLTERVVANAYDLGPRSALTGPIARRDWDTVRGQMAAAGRVAPELAEAFSHLAQATAYVVGTKLPDEPTRAG